MALNQNTTLQYSQPHPSEGWDHPTQKQSVLPPAGMTALNEESVLPPAGMTVLNEESVLPPAGMTAFNNNRWGALLKHANELGKSSLLENKANRQRQWTPEKRAQQAKIINDNKPWSKSSGAKTEQGKRNSSQNALKHGVYSRAFKKLRAVLRQQEAIRRVIHQNTWEKIRALHEIRAKTRAMTQPTLTSKTKEAYALLKQDGLNVSYHEVKRMVKEATGLTETDYITAPDKALLQAEIDTLEQIVNRRMAGEPLSRIMGEREFWGLNFKVTPDVLDPRPDTETLVEAVLKYAQSELLKARPPACGHGDNLRVLDLGTGTGCIPIALLTEYPNAVGFAVEYSEPAARIARENAIKNGVSDRFHIIQGDWMDALKPQTFDIITSNPPYIIESDIENLDIEVKNHDPHLALSGGVDGLDDYKKIISQLKTHLKKDGAAFLEIGFGQLDALARLSEESRLTLCDSVADIQGIQRVVEIRQNRDGGDK